MATPSPRSTDVFISYSSVDLRIADSIRIAFETAGVTCWMATEAMREGADWAAQIPPAITSARVFVLVLSADASASLQVAREVHIAMRSGRRVIPYRVDSAEPSGPLEYFLAGLHRIDASPSHPDQRIGDLLDRLRGSFAGGDAGLPGLEPTSVPHNLPSQLHQLVGREQDLFEVNQLVRSHRLVTIIGPGGVGKTSLAIAASRASLGTFPHGVWYVELAPVSENEIVTATISAILPPDNASRYLVIIDNCEHLIEGVASFLTDFLGANPNAFVLATSREPLRLRDEVRYALAPLAAPIHALRVPSLAELDRSPAARLLLQRAAQHASIHLDQDSERIAVAEICSRLDGLPLALELAAARCSALSFAQISQGIDQRFRLLTKGPRRQLEHHQTLLALIDWSFNLLSSAEQAVYARFGAFPGRFTIDDLLASVCSEQDRFDLIDTVDALIDRSLLVPSDATTFVGAKYYDLLESVRAFLRKRLEDAGHYATRATEVARRGLDIAKTSVHVEKSIHILNDNFDNIRFCLSWFSGEGHELSTAADLTGSLQRFWIESGRWSEGNFWTQTLISRKSELPRDSFRVLILAAAAIAGYREDYVSVIHSYEQLADASDRSVSAAERARVLNGMAFAKFHLGEFEQARSLFIETTKILDGLGDRLRSAMVSQNLALLEQRVDRNLKSAELRCIATCEVFSTEGAPFYNILSLLLLAEIALSRGDTAQALTHANQAVFISRSLGVAQYVADGNLLVAKITARSGSTLQCAILVKEAMSFYAVDSRREIAECALLAAKMAIAQSSMKAASQLLEHFSCERTRAKIPPLDFDLVLATQLENDLPEAMRAKGQHLDGFHMDRRTIAILIAEIVETSIDASLS